MGGFYFTIFSLPLVNLGLNLEQLKKQLLMEIFIWKGEGGVIIQYLKPMIRAVLKGNHGTESTDTVHLFSSPNSVHLSVHYPKHSLLLSSKLIGEALKFSAQLKVWFFPLLIIQTMRRIVCIYWLSTSVQHIANVSNIYE